VSDHLGRDREGTTSHPTPYGVDMRRASATLLALAALFGCSDDDPAASLDTNAAESASVDNVHCDSDDETGAFASGELTNDSETTWAYEVEVHWYRRDGKFYMGASDLTPNLPPHFTYVFQIAADAPEAVGPDTPGDQPTCRVVDVQQRVPLNEATIDGSTDVIEPPAGWATEREEPPCEDC